MTEWSTIVQTVVTKYDLMLSTYTPHGTTARESGRTILLFCYAVIYPNLTIESSGCGPIVPDRQRVEDFRRRVWPA